MGVLVTLEYGEVVPQERDVTRVAELVRAGGNLVNGGVGGTGAECGMPMVEAIITSPLGRISQM